MFDQPRASRVLVLREALACWLMAALGSLFGRLAILFAVVTLGGLPLIAQAQEEPSDTPTSATNPLLNPPTPTPVPFEAPPSPAECRVAPRPVEDFVVVPDAATSRTGPVVTPSSADDLPQGQPADAATVSAIEAVERQRVACWNANDCRRLFAYYTDEFLWATLAEYGPDADEEITADFLASPQAWNRRDWLPVRVSDVRLLPEGRAAAIVDTCEQVSYHVYEFVGVVLPRFGGQ